MNPTGSASHRRSRRCALPCCIRDLSTPQVVADLKARDPSFQPTEDELNVWAYKLLEQKQPGHALEVLRLNTLLFASSWNVYDSLAEILEDTGERPGAIANYARSFKLNPENQNAAYHLDKLRGK
jgi:predicted Zn-dependent protease